MKTYRERIKSLPAWKSGFPVSRAEALRVADAADALQAECEALRADAERMTWCTEHLMQVQQDLCERFYIAYIGADGQKVLAGPFNTLRAAIDNERSKV